MFAIINIAIGIVLLVMMFGVYSKLGELNIAIKNLSKPAAPAEPPAPTST